MKRILLTTGIFIILLLSLISAQSPEFTVIPDNATLTFTTPFNVTFAAINTSATNQVDSFTVNSTLFSMNPATGVLTNATLLGVATYQMIVSVNQTLDGNTTSVQYQLSVTQSNGTCSLSFSPSNSVGFLDPVNVSGSCNTPISNFTRDGVDNLAQLGSIVTLDEGDYSYFIISTGNQNISSGNATANLIVGPRSSLLQICTDSTTSFVASVGLSGIVLLIVLVGGIIFLLFLILRGGGVSGMGELFSTQNIIAAVITILVLFVVVALGAFILGDSLCQAITS